MANYKNNKSSNNNYWRQYNDAKNNKQKKSKSLNASERHEIVNIKKEIKVPAFATALEYIGKMCLILLAFVAIIIDTFYVYYRYIDQDETVGINYITEQNGLDIINLEDLSDKEKNEYEDRVFMEASFYDNSNNNGIALQELNFNYFTDYTLTSDKYRSTGMQYLGDLKTSDLTLNQVVDSEVANKAVNNGFVFYDTTDGITYDGGKVATVLNRDQDLIIKIDNEPYKIKLDGYTYFTTYTYGFWGKLGKKNKPVKNKLYYTYVDVFADVMQAIRSNSKGYIKDAYIKLDLSEYFQSVQKYNPETKHFDQPAADIIKNYAYLKFSFHKNGVKNCSQSLFKKINLDSTYGLDQSKLDDELYRTEINYNLEVKDLDYRYSAAKEGHLAFLDMEKINLLKNTKHSIINLIINLDDQYLINKNYKLIGFDYSAFKDLKINSIQIKSKNNIDFYILDNALNGVDNINIVEHDKVNLIISDNAFKTLEVVA